LDPNAQTAGTEVVLTPSVTLKANCSGEVVMEVLKVPS
jgi:hypothetical protein